MPRGPAATRRSLIVGAAAIALLPPAAWARDGFVIDWEGGEKTPKIAAFLEGQIRLVEKLPVSKEAMDFFRAEVIHVDREMGTKTRARDGVHFAREVMPDDNPVLLHELIHRWQWAKMQGPRDPRIVKFYEAAKASGDWPAQSYMLTNPLEFFGMTGSVVLHGRAARPPFTRAAVKAKMPDLYAFIVKEFGADSLA